MTPVVTTSTAISSLWHNLWSQWRSSNSNPLIPFKLGTMGCAWETSRDETNRSVSLYSIKRTANERKILNAAEVRFNPEALGVYNK